MTAKFAPGAVVYTADDPVVWPAPQSPISGAAHIISAIDCSTNPNYPAATQGDIYKVSVAGRLGGASGAQVDVGDVAIAMLDSAAGDQATVGANWTILEHNLVGALLAANNLSDVASAVTARGNLGLGTVAVLASDIDGTLTANSDLRIPTQKAVVTFVNTQIATAGAGDVVGPASAVSGNLPVFNGTTGKLVSDSGVAPGSLAPLASPTFSGTPAAPTAAAATNTTQLATTAFVQAAVSAAVAGLLNFKGTTDCSANPNYPSAAKGDAYIVSVAGKIGGASGTTADVGDWYVATAANAGGTEAAVGTSWGHMEHNLVGALLASNNLSDLASATTALTNLGLSANSKSLVTAANYAAMKTLLAIAPGDLSGLAAGIATFLGTSSSANLAAALTDETGSGAAVFANTPTLLSPKIEANGTAASYTMKELLTYGVTWTTSVGGAADEMLFSNNGGSALAYTFNNGSVGTNQHFRSTAPVTETAATHTVATTTNYLIANRAGTITVTLPTPSTYTGRSIIIKTIQAQTVVSASSNVVPLNGGSASTPILAATIGKWAQLVSDGTSWVIMAAA